MLRFLLQGQHVLTGKHLHLLEISLRGFWHGNTFSAITLSLILYHIWQNHCVLDCVDKWVPDPEDQDRTLLTVLNMLCAFLQPLHDIHYCTLYLWLYSGKVFSGIFWNILYIVHIQCLYMEGLIHHRFLISYNKWGTLYIFGNLLGCVYDYINCKYWGISCYDWPLSRLWKLTYLPAETAKEFYPRARDSHCTSTRSNTWSDRGMHWSDSSLDCCVWMIDMFTQQL